MSYREQDLNRSLKGGLGIGVSIVSLYLPVVGWIYTGYMLLDLIGAFDRPIIQPIRKEPYIIEADNTRIIRPVIDTSFLPKKSLIIGYC